jgi:hypothetical protein
MSPRQRLGVVVLGVAVLVIAFVIAQGSGDDNGDKTTATTAPAASTPSGTAPATTTPAAPPVPTIVVQGGKPTGGVKDIEVSKGDRIRFKVRSDVADEIHVHGYDLMKDVQAGGSVSFDFKASIDGKFEVELEGRKEQIASLVVEP